MRYLAPVLLFAAVVAGCLVDTPPAERVQPWPSTKAAASGEQLHHPFPETRP